MDNKKILIIAYYFPPSSGAGVQRPLKFAKYLPSYGYTPIVCCPNPRLMRHKKDNTFKKDIPSSVKVYKTFLIDLNWLFKIFYGLNINFIVRWINEVLLFPAYQLQWIPFLKITLKKILRKEQIDAVLITAPPHSNFVISKWLKQKYKLPIVFDYRDPFSFSFEINDSQTFQKRFLFEKSLLKNADYVLTVTPTFKRKMEEAFCLNKISLITNGYDEDDFIDDSFLYSKMNENDNNTLVISYIGKTYGENTTLPFLYALNKIKETLKGIEIRYIGSFTKKELNFIKQNKLDSIVKLTPYCSHNEVIAYYKESDILLLVVANEKWKYVIPGKVFEYMQTGKPILAIIPEDGDVAEILRETSSSNLIVSPNRLVDNPELILESFYHIKDLKTNHEAVLKYSRKELTKKLANIFDSLLNK